MTQELCPWWGKDDGAGSCTPTLASCGPSEISTGYHAPACTRVGTCEDAWWIGLPTDAQYVDPSYQGGESDGTRERPWNYVEYAESAAKEGQTIVLAPGEYDPFTISKPHLTIRGACVDSVKVRWFPGYPAALKLNGVAGVQVTNLTVEGQLSIRESSDVELSHIVVIEQGILVEYADNVSIDRVLVRDYEGEGIAAIGSTLDISTVEVRDGKVGYYGYDKGIAIRSSETKPGKARIHHTVVSGALDYGIYAHDSHIIVSESVIRDMQPYASSAVHAMIDGEVEEPLELVMSRTLLLDNHGLGVSSNGAEASLDRIVITGMKESFPAAAIQAGDSLFHPDHTPVVEITNTVVDDAVDVGIGLTNVEATVRNTIVRNVQGEIPAALLAMTRDRASDGSRTNVRIEHSHLETAGAIALAVLSADVEVSGSWVVDSAEEGSRSLGTIVVDYGSGQPLIRPRLRMQDSLVQGSAAATLYNLGGDVELERCAFGAFGPDSEVDRGRALNSQPAADGQRGDLRVDGCSFSGFSGATLALFGTQGAVRNSSIAATTRSGEDANDGFGIVALDGSDVKVEDTRVEGAARAAIGAQGAWCRVEDSDLACNGYDWTGDGVQMERTGCGCGEETAWCSQDEAIIELPRLEGVEETGAEDGSG